MNKLGATGFNQLRDVENKATDSAMTNQRSIFATTSEIGFQNRLEMILASKPSTKLLKCGTRNRLKPR